MLDTFLFDLDGTLLPMDLDEFIKNYFYEIGKYFKDIIDGNILASHIMTSTQAMIENLEPRPNEEIFMEYFGRLIEEEDLSEYKRRFDLFYDEKFDRVRKCAKDEPIIRKSIEVLKDKGYDLVIATNPIFPISAIHKRIEWAGLDIDDFSYISCYQKNYYCKPQRQFYQEILETINKQPHQCYMVGNDVQEDLVAGQLGMYTYLITDYMINRDDGQIECTHKGDYQDFYQFVYDLEPVKKAVI